MLNRLQRTLRPWHIQLFLFLSCTGLLSFGYYLQYVEYMEPCPLCISQRLCFYAVGILALIGLLSRAQGRTRTLLTSAGLLSSLIGAATAGRQVWLQHLPADQVPACGPGFNYLADTLPWHKVMTIMLKGDGNCAAIDWTLLNLSIADWSLLAFIGFCITHVLLLLRK